MRGTVYILTNRPNGTLYLGVTADLSRRVFEHREGRGGTFTRRYGLRRLVWFEHGAEEPRSGVSKRDIRTAIQRERTMKGYSRAWKVRLILVTNPAWDDLYETLNGAPLP